MNVYPFRSCAVAVSAMLAMELMLFSHTATGGELTVACPGKIEEDTWRPVSVPEKWIGQMANSMHVQSGGLMLGPPNSRAYLAPAKHKIVGDELTNWYSLGNLDGEKWFYCDYSGTHAIQLYWRLDDEVSECVARFSGVKVLRKLTVTCK